MVAVGGVGASGWAPSRLGWSLVVVATQCDLRDDRLSDADLVFGGGLLFPRRAGWGCLARGGEHISVARSCHRVVSSTLTAGIEASPESLQHGRWWRGRWVAPAENNRLPVLLGRRLIGRRSGARATGDVSGQPLGLIPFLGGRGT